MAERVTVIDIDLGMTANGAIQEELIRLSDVTTAKVQELVEHSNRVADTFEKRATEAADKRATQNAWFEQMLVHINAQPNGLPVDKLLDAIDGKYASLSAFTLAMRRYLLEQGKHLVLEKHKHRMVPHYRLVAAYQTEQPAPPPAASTPTPDHTSPPSD